MGRTRAGSFLADLNGYEGATALIAMPEGGNDVRIYERPTLTRLGSFKKLTGIGGSGPKDTLVRHQSL